MNQQQSQGGNRHQRNPREEEEKKHQPSANYQGEQIDYYNQATQREGENDQDEEEGHYSPTNRSYLDYYARVDRENQPWHVRNPGYVPPQIPPERPQRFEQEEREQPAPFTRGQGQRPGRAFGQESQSPCRRGPRAEYDHRRDRTEYSQGRLYGRAEGRRGEESRYGGGQRENRNRSRDRYGPREYGGLGFGSPSRQDHQRDFHQRGSRGGRGSFRGSYQGRVQYGHHDNYGDRRHDDEGIKYLTNHFKINLSPETKIQVYEMRLNQQQPAIETEQRVQYFEPIFLEHRETIRDLLGEVFHLSGFIFLSMAKPQEEYADDYEVGRIEEPRRAQISIHKIPKGAWSWAQVFRSDEPLFKKAAQFILTKLTRRLIRRMDFGQIGHNPKFFSRKTISRPLGDSKLVSIRGFHVDVVSADNQLFWVVDVCTKFLHERTVLQSFNDAMRNGYSVKEFKDKFHFGKNPAQTQVVFTSHLSRFYDVIEMDATLKPSTCLFKDSHGRDVSIRQYYQEKYNKRLIEDQPMLHVRGYYNQSFYVPSELCYMAKILDQFKRHQKDLQFETILPPEKRKDDIDMFIEDFLKEENQSHELQRWGFKINNTMEIVIPKQVPMPEMIPSSTAKGGIGERLGDHQSLGPFQLMVFYRSKYRRENNRSQANQEEVKENVISIVSQLQKTAQQYGSSFYTQVEGQNVNNCVALIDLDRMENFRRSFGVEDIPGLIDAYIKVSNVKPAIALILLEKQMGDRDYKDLKKILFAKGIPSQAMKKDVTREHLIPISVCRVLVQQILAKINTSLYKMRMRPEFERVMVIGIDIAQYGPLKIFGMCSSLNGSLTSYNNEFDSFVLSKDQVKQRDGTKRWEEFERLTIEYSSKVIVRFVEQAMIQYRDANDGQFPKNVVIFRNGVGGPSFVEKALNGEVYDVTQFLLQFRAKVGYIMIDENTTTRFFKKDSLKRQNQISNIPLGFLIDEQIIPGREEKLSFYLNSFNYSISRATAIPVLYRVVQNSLPWSDQVLQEFVYLNCFLYYGYNQGPTKLPAVVAYGDHLAKSVVQYNVHLLKKPGSNDSRPRYTNLNEIGDRKWVDPSLSLKATKFYI